MIRSIFMVGIVLSVASIGQASTLSLSPASGLTYVTVDQPAGQFTKVGLPGQALVNLPPGDTFYTDATQVWITDVNGNGSLHTFNYFFGPYQWIAVRPLDGQYQGYQPFSYEYAKAGTNPLVRWELGPTNLPYMAASLSVVPEPSSIVLGLFGIAGLGMMRRY